MRKSRNVLFFSIVIIIAVFVCTGFYYREAFAQYDTLEGPVVKDAKLALDKKDVTPMLKWVKREREIEVCEAFNKALAQRNKSAQDKAVADTAFFEVVIKAHREGEGFVYTGIKPAQAIPNLNLLEADVALDKGSSETLQQLVAFSVTSAIQERFNKVVEKKKLMNDSIDAAREYITAYVKFINYLEELSRAIEAK